MCRDERIIGKVGIGLKEEREKHKMEMECTARSDMKITNTLEKVVSKVDLPKQKKTVKLIWLHFDGKAPNSQIYPGSRQIQQRKESKISAMQVTLQNCQGE